MSSKYISKSPFTAGEILLALLWDDSKREFVFPERFEDIQPGFLESFGKGAVRAMKRFYDARDREIQAAYERFDYCI